MTESSRGVFHRERTKSIASVFDSDAHPLSNRNPTTASFSGQKREHPTRGSNDIDHFLRVPFITPLSTRQRSWHGSRHGHRATTSIPRKTWHQATTSISRKTWHSRLRHAHRLESVQSLLRLPPHRFPGEEARPPAYLHTGAHPIIRNPENKKLLTLLGYCFTLTSTIIPLGSRTSTLLIIVFFRFLLSHLYFLCKLSNIR
jgi:hypothetical protein